MLFWYILQPLRGLHCPAGENKKHNVKDMVKFRLDLHTALQVHHSTTSINEHRPSDRSK